MKTYQLAIQANKRPETLERLLRVMRHRGFEISELQSKTTENVIALDVKVKSQRDIALLTHQLVKLPDVMEVREETNA
ncbi:acetolactate synthase 2 small subunit [Otariodibacter oris]|uniref:Acetolactate synthase small subunit n=1 Tax=Otariodibacter oris TaxID=1032623 RepID=A0A420XGU9_9PAST|nr:acetolactate synthase 2 small subunit [Otariodibacter oris]QGM81198.1 acetolactate synthase [Otariodibacter oris]RKR72758.1 acetolactate synthase small subunit [Otariodibacter oris]